MYPTSSKFVLFSSETSRRTGFLTLSRGFSEDAVRKTASSETSFCAAASVPDAKEITVCDDGGNPIERYRGLVPQEIFESQDTLFAVFSVCGFRCGLSGGWDLLIPEHSRALSDSGVELLCCLPSGDIPVSVPLKDIARVRAVENKIFTALLSPHEQEAFCWDPSGIPVQSEVEHGERIFTLFHCDIARARKINPLHSPRKKQLRYALMHL